MNQSNLSRYFQFALVVLAAGSIYPLIYLRQNYQQTIIEVFQIEIAQLNMLYTILGFVFVVGYLPSGWLADKFEAKWLLVLSLFMTGLGGLWFAQVPSPNTVKIIFALWGIFAVFTFWSSHVKIVKLLSKANEEGRFFGILDGGRGTVEALLATLAVFIFSRVIGGVESMENKHDALVAVIYMYSAVLIVLSILIAVFLNTKGTTRNREIQNETKSFSENIEHVGKVIKHKSVLMHGLIIAAGYTLFWAVYYVGGFLQVNTGSSAVMVGTITTTILWMRPIGGVLAGFLGDKIGRRKILGIVLGAGSIILLVIAFLPYTVPQVLFYVLAILFGLMVYGVRGTYWALLGEHKLSEKVLGFAIGFISLLGYLPDIIIPPINTRLFNTFGDNKGYNSYFIFSAICGIIGVLLVISFVKMHKNNIKKATRVND